MDSSDVFCITFCQIVVNGYDMNAFSFKCIKICRHSCNQSVMSYNIISTEEQVFIVINRKAYHFCFFFFFNDIFDCYSVVMFTFITSRICKHSSVKLERITEEMLLHIIINIYIDCILVRFRSSYASFS